MNAFLLPIGVPVLLGLGCLALPRSLRIAAEALAVAGSAAALASAAWLFSRLPLRWTVNGVCLLNLDALSGFIVLAAALFGVLISVYSLRFMKDHPEACSYYGYFLISLGCAIGALVSNHLVLLLVFWGILGITLYAMILVGGEGAAAPAKKTLLLVGGSDAAMLLGIVLVHGLASTFEADRLAAPLQGATATVAFVALAVAAFAKAGAFPLHTWIPDAAEAAPVPATAFLPAALDKLLGIYLLVRICVDWFAQSPAMRTVLMALGALTVITAVMMALIQHDIRRLLAYHAVSQVGYMVLGIGTGNPVGIAGGLFHMLNHSIYKSCLFLTGGAVQHRTNETDLDHLGGLGRFMPVTWACFLVAAFSISGVPPFNGFASKWMIYQGLIQAGQNGDSLWMVWLVAALFGSALTLASFMKLAHAVFLGSPSPETESRPVKEVGFGMAAPMVILAALCVVFGVFATRIPIPAFLAPVVPGIEFSGLWEPGTATVLILAGLAVGLCLYWLGNGIKVRRTDRFMGGEELPAGDRITGSQFYKTFRDLPGFRTAYARAEARVFDLYDQGARLALWIAGFLRRAHTGVLTMYMAWLVVGLVALLFVLMRR